METYLDDNDFAKKLNEFQGQKLKYFDIETGTEKEDVLERVWIHPKTQKYVAYFKHSSFLGKVFLPNKKVPLRLVLLPGATDSGKATRKHSGSSQGYRYPFSETTDSGTMRPRTRQSFLYDNHYYHITYWENFKTGDEVVWNKCTRNEQVCIGKIVITAEREDVINHLDYREVAIVNFDTRPYTQTGYDAPGYFAYESGLFFTYVVPMKELLSLQEWISIATTEEDNEWTVVGKNGKPSKHNSERDEMQYSPQNDPNQFAASREFQESSSSRSSAPPLEFDEFIPKWDDEWQFPMNRSEFFKTFQRTGGNGMGVQGNNNSCYMDSCLYGLFAFNESLDYFLVQVGTDNESVGNKVKKIIRDAIIFPMRQRYFVPHGHVHELRTTLSKHVREDYLSRYMDVEEFLVDLFKLIDTPSFFNYDNEEGDYIHQITLPFTWEENQYQPYLTLQSLLEKSFDTYGVKLAKRPENVFIVKLPISDGVLIPCAGVIPNLTLDLSRVLVAPESVNRNGRMMRLHAVICLKRNHFVVFVRSENGDNAPWVFMDSNPTAQQPYVSVLPDLDESILRAVTEVESGAPPAEINYEPFCEKFALFRNAYICIYV